MHCSTRSLKRVAITVEQSHCRSLTVHLCGKPHPSILQNAWAWHNFEGVVSWCPLFGIDFVLKSHVGNMSLVRCPESLGGHVSIKVMLDTIRNTTVVRCREAVVFSEGPLSEAQLYIYVEVLNY